MQPRRDVRRDRRQRRRAVGDARLTPDAPAGRDRPAEQPAQERAERARVLGQLGGRPHLTLDVALPDTIESSPAVTRKRWRAACSSCSAYCAQRSSAAEIRVAATSSRAAVAAPPSSSSHIT